jgi:hypothetical protein
VQCPSRPARAYSSTSLPVIFTIRPSDSESKGFAIKGINEAVMDAWRCVPTGAGETEMHNGGSHGAFHRVRVPISSTNQLLTSSNRTVISLK